MSGAEEVVQCIAELRKAFGKINMKAPKAIMLESRDEGMKFLSLLSQHPGMVPFPGGREFGRAVEMADGTICMEAMVLDVLVRWPACRMATPDGRWVFT